MSEMENSTNTSNWRTGWAKTITESYNWDRSTTPTFHRAHPTWDITFDYLYDLPPHVLVERKLNLDCIRNRFARRIRREFMLLLCLLIKSGTCTITKTKMLAYRTLRENWASEVILHRKNRTKIPRLEFYFKQFMCGQLLAQSEFHK